MDKIKIILADDERYSREELRHLLSEYTCIEIADEADNGEAAVMKALKHQPHAVFLDVEMPKMNGMEAAKSLMELKKPPLIIFATAYPQFAAEAFKYEAIDYLLKPYDEEQLKRTVQRIQRLVQPAGSDIGSALPAKLAIETEGEIFYLDPKDILYIYRDEKATKVVTKNESYYTKTLLKDLEAKLAPFRFFRIHKSYLVNLEYAAKLTPWFNGAYQLELTGTKEVLGVSRNYVKALRERLEIH
ncbi:LytTR family DNA-binding domain-containing protein [Metabacillus indicus]|uniref:LytR/AlgR family response regulator transcription factor n=1 Tax=Metabacillus indicus TaxID=246786 RepID=UPI002A014FEF|nr:LytTR family DNA-binding domain-containing protein [Metabacillus indicus]MDX8289263.1 LytTR family DNA-binding domain-containing protein [Metabacillus indicus]